MNLHRLTGCGFVWKRSRSCLSDHRLQFCNIHRCSFCDHFKETHGIRQCLHHDTGIIPRHLLCNMPNAFELICPAGALELIVPFADGDNIYGVILAGPFSPPGKNLPGLPPWNTGNKSALIQLLRHLVEPLAPALARRNSVLKVKDPRIKLILEYLELHFRENPELSTLAGMVFLSTSRFSHLFRQECGMYLSAYINQLKLAEALELLRESSNSIAEVAHLCGFPDPNHFSTLFKKRYGKTPRQIRKEWHSELY